MSENEREELNSILAEAEDICGNDYDRRGIILPAFGIPEPERKNTEDIGNYTQWSTKDNKVFFPSMPTTPKLIPGMYSVCHSHTDGIYFERIMPKTQGLVRFPQTNSEKVLEEIQKFWDKEAEFKKNKLTFKRGILLWGFAGCLDKDTIISYETRDYSGKKRINKTVAIERLYQVFHGLTGKGKGRYQKSSPGKTYWLASVDENNHITKNLIENVIASGEKECYLIKTKSGKEIITTADHKFFTGNKYEPLSDLRDGDIVFVAEHARIHGVIKPPPPIKITPDEILSIRSCGMRETYDICMKSPYNNFVANKFVVHNSGKSCLLQLIVEDVINRGGICIIFDNPSLFRMGMRILRQIQPETPVVVLMEDIDAILEDEDESEVLQILDGIEDVQRCVFLATTNYPKKLGPRIVNRPSRFDKAFQIREPNEESRKIYFDFLFDNYPNHEVDVNKWVADTDGLSIAHLKELFVATIIMGDGYDTALKTIRGMKENPADRDKKKLGFNQVEE